MVKSYLQKLYGDAIGINMGIGSSVGTDFVDLVYGSISTNQSALCCFRVFGHVD